MDNYKIESKINILSKIVDSIFIAILLYNLFWIKNKSYLF